MTSLRLEKQGFLPSKAVQCCPAAMRECSRTRGCGLEGEGHGLQGEGHGLQGEGHGLQGEGCGLQGEGRGLQGEETEEKRYRQDD